MDEIDDWRQRQAREAGDGAGRLGVAPGSLTKSPSSAGHGPDSAGAAAVEARFAEPRGFEISPQALERWRVGARETVHDAIESVPAWMSAKKREWAEHPGIHWSSIPLIIGIILFIAAIRMFTKTRYFKIAKASGGGAFAGVCLGLFAFVIGYKALAMWRGCPNAAGCVDEAWESLAFGALVAAAGFKLAWRFGGGRGLGFLALAGALAALWVFGWRVP